MSTAYHLQTDEQTEQVNQTLEQYIQCYVSEVMDDWAHLLSSVEFVYNNTAHESTKNTPFFIEYGRHPRAGPTLDKATKWTNVNDIMWARQEAQNKAKAVLELAAERMK
jgi:hypothetical protein